MALAFAVDEEMHHGVPTSPGLLTMRHGTGLGYDHPAAVWQVRRKSLRLPQVLR